MIRRRTFGGNPGCVTVVMDALFPQSFKGRSHATRRHARQSAETRSALAWGAKKHQLLSVAAPFFAPNKLAQRSRNVGALLVFAFGGSFAATDVDRESAAI